MSQAKYLPPVANNRKRPADAIEYGWWQKSPKSHEFGTPSARHQLGPVHHESGIRQKVPNVPRRPSIKVAITIPGLPFPVSWIAPVVEGHHENQTPPGLKNLQHC